MRIRVRVCGLARLWLLLFVSMKVFLSKRKYPFLNDQMELFSVADAQSEGHIAVLCLAIICCISHHISLDV